MTTEEHGHDGHRREHHPGHDAEHGRTDGERRQGHGHGHGNGQGAGSGEVDWAEMADLLELEGETNAPYVEQALAELGHLTPHRILDIGSGPGVAACAFAAAFPAAEVVAVDGEPELLARAEQRAKRLAVRLHTRVAEFPAGFDGLGLADLVWSSHVVHHVGDQQDALRRLAGLLRPGGVLAITEGGLPTRWLPRDPGFGRPGLQARLDAAQAEWFNGMRTELPDSVPVREDWPAMLRAAGLVDVAARSYLVEHPAPLAEGPRRAVRLAFERYRGAAGELLDADDLATLDRLLDPADPEGLDQRPDLFLLRVRTVITGRRPG